MADSSQDHQDAIQPTAFQPLSEAAPAQKRGVNKVRLAGISVAAIFLVIMLFLLTSRSVQITVVAESEHDISIKGLYLPFGTRYLMRPGSYAMTATAQGYYDLNTDLLVTEQDSQVLELIMQPLPGLLTVTGDRRHAMAVVGHVRRADVESAVAGWNADVRIRNLEFEEIYRLIATSDGSKV